VAGPARAHPGGRSPLARCVTAAYGGRPAGGSDTRPKPWPPGPRRATGETDPPADSARSRVPPMTQWLLNVARRGRVYTFEEYAAMLAEAGFGPARRLEGVPWLQAERAE